LTRFPADFVAGPDLPLALMLAAPRSGSGKTTVTLGLLRAFRRQGIRVVGVKSGPDYIDPAFHAVASGREGLNLDSWSMPPSLVAALAARAAEGSDLLLCEASMGLFDGVPAPPGRTGASADVAAALGMPVVLVLDVSGQAQSAAAVLKGCASYDPRIRIVGVILNRVGSPRHRRLAGEAIEAQGVPILGALPRLDDLALPERHLGLVQAVETDRLDARLDRIGDRIAEHIDLHALRACAAPLGASNDAPAPIALAPPGQRIALASDSAFSFIYPHLLSDWRAAGAQIRFFSPLADEAPPEDCDFCWLPGGYPELHAARLATASHFMGGMRSFASTRPVHGECGGYMALGASLTDASGARHAMAGLLGVETSFARRKMTLGYREISLAADCALGPLGARFRGHEFHYSTLAGDGADAPFALAGDAYGATPAPSGSRRGLVTGSYFHVIAAA
jgi:cobyrinic acid a,c-diamide synthase